MDLETVLLHCALCGAPWEIVIDPSAGTHQRYTEDCSTCCGANVIEVRVDREGVVEVTNEAE